MSSIYQVKITLFGIIKLMKVYVARHAETNYNVLGLCNGDPAVNVYLTSNGIKQAHLLAKSLKNIPFELIITSEFPRTKETAAIVNEHHNAPMDEDSRINDLVSGFEGKLVSDFNRARRESKNRWTVRLNNGESFEDEKARVQAFLNDLKSKHHQACVLIITHQAIAQIIYALVNKLPNEKVNDIEMDNAQCFEFYA